MDEFRTKILQEVREVMLREQQHESGLKTWQGGEAKGFEIVFEGAKRGVPIQSGVVGQIFISQDGGFEAIINAYVVKNQLRSIVCSFTATPCSSLPTQIAANLSALSLAVTSTLSVTHLLMMPEVRQRLLNALSTKHVALLAQTCKSARSSLTNSTVDGSYWKEHLKSEFGAEKVRETIAKNRTFYGVYCEERMRIATRREPVRRLDDNPLMVGPPRGFDPLRDPRHEPFYPRNDPDAEFFNPQGGFLPPGARPFGGGPNIPDLFRGPDHPDLNPMGMPRGGRGNQGNPFMRGGPGGGFI